ncbi:MAG: hypothetical protein SPF07_01285 [Eubacteriales bacterium]|nr:hypothetical protein [Eubacteriales bacterium]
MKKHFMYYVSAFVLCMFSCVLLTACGKTDYDMSGVSLQDATYTYDGNSHVLEVTGDLPTGVTAEYKYYVDETHETEATSTVDTGKYYVVVSFTGDAKHNPIEDMSAVMTINKADYPSLDVTIKATYKDDQNQDASVVARDNGDGTLYLESINKEYTISVNSATQDGNITTEFYNRLNADGTVDETSKSLTNTLTNYGDKVYIKVTVSDDNHNPISVVKTVNIERKTVEIRTYEDLENMNKDLFTKTMEERVNLRYLLLNDIDCEGKVWKTIGPGYQNSGKNFVGEFNGNGHTISNFKLTEDSLNYTLDLGTSIEKVSTAIYGSSTSCIHIGFFGYVVSADIHDITFDNVTTSIDMKKLNDEDKVSIHAYYGTAVARCEANDTIVSNINPCSSIYNVTVKNTNINIQAGKMFVGSVIGTDANKNTDTKTFLRKNLKAENVNIAVAQWALDKKAVQRNRMSVGGIVAETQDGNIANYEDCIVRNVNVEIKAHSLDNGSGTTLSPQNPFDIYTKSNLNVGSILGYNKNSHAGVSLNNCISSNFNAKIYADNLDQVKFSGSYGNNDAKGNVDGAVDTNGQPIPAFQVNNCTYTGVVEVYIMGGTIKDGIDANPDQAGTAIDDDMYTSYTPDKYDPNYVYVNGELVTE